MTERDPPTPGGRTDRGRRLRFVRRLGVAFEGGVTLAAVAVVAVAAALAALLVVGALPSLLRFGPRFLVSSAWGEAGSSGPFGALPAIAGTLLTSGLALLLAVPVALGVALFASEIAPRWLRDPLAYFVDLGAAVPSIVYGFWARLVLVPWLQSSLEPSLRAATGGAPPFSGLASGMDVLAASLILAIMIVPTIAALSREAMRAVPRDLREGALALGATRWEASRLTVLGPASPGLVGAVVLGLGRAIGETIAVALVIGSTYQVPLSLFAPGTTIPSALVNGFLNSTGLGLSALYELAVILLALSVAINVGARFLVRRLEARAAGAARRRASAPRPALAAYAAAAPEPGRLPAWWARLAPGRSARRQRRRLVHATVVVLVVAAVAAAAYPLASLLATAVANGGAAVVRPSFYTSTPPPSCGIGEANCPLGGIGPEIQGTLVMLGLAAALALPAGVAVGIYLSEYGRHRLGRSAALVVDVLVGVPTILLGVFVFTVFLRFDRLDDQSAFAGAAALAVLMVPIVAKATEGALRTVPASVREGALALGFPRHRVTWRIVLGSCRRTLVTGSLLAVMRAAGETAALIVTAGGSIYWISDLRAPTGSLPTFIYYALTNYPSANYTTDAWGAALVLLLIMAAVSLAARLSVRGPDGSGAA